MQGPDERRTVQRLIRRLATGAALLVLVVIATSAYLRHAQAGLGCTDWPQCYGRIVSPAQETDVPAARKYARMLHRVAATAVAAVLLALALVSWTQRPLLYKQSGIVAATILVTLLLAVLGASTPGSRLPAVALVNLGGGFLLFALLGWLRSTTDPEQLAPAAALRPWAFVTLVLLVAQIVLGGLIGAEFGALSCTGFPGCDADWRGGTMAQLDPFRELAVGPEGAVISAPALVAVHLAHRLMALVIVCCLIWLANKLLALGGAWRRSAWTLFALAGLQAVLGVTAVRLSLPIGLVVAHNATAALLLFSLVGIACRLRGP